MANNVKDLNQERVNDHLFSQIEFPNNDIFLYGPQYQNSSYRLQLINSTDMKFHIFYTFSYDVNSKMELCGSKIVVASLNTVESVDNLPPGTLSQASTSAKEQ